MSEIVGTAWKNSRAFPPGDAGYGIKIDGLADRERFFPRGAVKLHLEGYPVPIVVNTDKKSFWTSTCGELISVEIGKWLRLHALIPWADGSPPKFKVVQLSTGTFEVRFAA